MRKYENKYSFVNVRLYCRSGRENDFYEIEMTIEQLKELRKHFGSADIFMTDTWIFRLEDIQAIQVLE